MNDNRWKAIVFIVVLVVEALLVIRLFAGPGDQQGVLVGAIVVVAAALILVPRVFDLSQLKVPGFTAQLQAMSQSLDETRSSVQATDAAVESVNRKLDTLFALSISDWQYQNLEKLTSGRFGPYVRSMGLENDLRHLRNHGYVEVPSVRDLPDTGEELCDYVAVTDTGRLFVELRQSLRLPNPILLKQPNLRPTNRVES